MIHVYLDDMRPCPKGFTLAKNAEECILLLQECEVGLLSLDHDLGWATEQTGMDVVRWMISQQRFPQEIYIHTSSSSARAAMYQMLYMSKPDGVKLVNAPLPDEVLLQISEGRRESG